MKILYSEENETFLHKDEKKPFSTKEGTILPADLTNPQATTNKGKTYTIFNADFLDQWKHLKRGAQIFQPKDVGAIIVHTGMGKDSVLVEAGGGSGKGTSFFANICKHIYCFERNPDHAKMIRSNLEALKLTNFTLIEDAIQNDKLEIAADIVILDLLDTSDAMIHASKFLKSGGRLVTYNPHMSQVSDIVNHEQVQKIYLHESTLESNERQWLVKGKQARPEFIQQVHSGFLSFCRKK